MEYNMASFYRNNGIWYISLGYNGKRKSKSLKTKDYNIALKLKPYAESQLINELTGLNNKHKELSFRELSQEFLKRKGLSKNTQLIYENVIKRYNQGNSLPTNPNSRSIHIRTINACWNWGLKNDLISKAYKLELDTKGEPRQRTYTDEELKVMFNDMPSIVKSFKTINYEGSQARIMQHTDVDYATGLTSKQDAAGNSISNLSDGEYYNLQSILQIL